MDIRSLFLGLLGLSHAAYAASTHAPTTSIDTYRDLFSDLLPRMPPANREWWLRNIQVGDNRKTSPLSNSERNTKTQMFNQARATTKPAATSMIELKYNLELEQALVKYRNNNNGSVFYSLKHSYPQRFPGRNVNLFGAHLLELPEFAAFKAANCTYWWHDTNKATERSENIVLRMRVNQDKFFNYNLCNKTAFNDFLSCITIHDNSPSGASSFTNRYYVRYIQPSLTSYALVRLRIPGAFTPNKQLAASWYYACGTKKIHYENDIPYVAGPRASACPTEYPVARKGLCARL